MDDPFTNTKELYKTLCGLDGSKLDMAYAARHSGRKPPADMARPRVIRDIMKVAYPGVAPEDYIPSLDEVDEPEVEPDPAYSDYTIDRIDLRLLMMQPGVLSVQGVAMGSYRDIESILNYYAQMVWRIAGDEKEDSAPESASFSVEKMSNSKLHLKFAVGGRPANVAKYLENLSHSNLF